MKIIPVLLAGGIGERFWPLSRSSRPKQLLKIVSKKTMVEETLSRVQAFCADGVKPLIVTSKSIAGPIRKLLKNTTSCDMIVEPVGKNTAPAVAAAAQWVQARYGNAVMVVLSADHAIRPKGLFTEAVRYAARISRNLHCLTVFGIPPTRPETGYGYLRIGSSLGEWKSCRAHKVKAFVEKPSAKMAKKYAASGNYAWNSGMFVWESSVILEELQRYMPDMYRQSCQLAKNRFTAAAIKTFYTRCPKESIDFGVMERSQRVAMVQGTFQWDDIGSWESMPRAHGSDEHNNTTVGPRAFLADCHSSVIVNDSSLQVAAFGLEDVVVVTTDDAVMVTTRENLPDLKKHLATLKESGTASRKLF